MISLIPPASMMRAKITLRAFGGNTFNIKEPIIPPKTTPAPTVTRGIVSRVPERRYIMALMKEIGKIMAIAVA